MEEQRGAIIVVAIVGILCISGWAAIYLSESLLGENNDTQSIYKWEDPLIQGGEHDHKNASDHGQSSENVEMIEYNSLTTPGNAEIQVAESPNGKVYAYMAGWNDVHIIDVTDPTNTTVMGVYNDPNTQVLDVKYLQYNGREYLILQNQLVDSGYADPNVGEWDDPIQVSVTLIDVTDKTDPSYVDSWFDIDHPSGPHNLYTHMIDDEWYIFVANPDYDQCDVGQGDACGGITIAHLNFEAYGDLPRIVKVGEAEVSWETTRGGWIYIHDMTVQTWPGEDQNDPRYGKTYIYGSYWEAGLRIFDVSDIPHPQNDLANYLWHGSLCRASGGSQAGCTWRAPEVGQWMEFADLDDDGEPDSQSTGNTNGGRASYIHYTEPYPVMVDLGHLPGQESGKRHITLAAVEVLSTSVGTGMVYAIDTTEYEMINGNMRFLPKVIGDWELPYAEDHCFGADCEAHPEGTEWLLFSPHNLDSAHFITGDVAPDQSYGGGWDGRLYISHYHAGAWIVDLETMIALDDSMNRTERLNEETIGFIIPSYADGTMLESQFYNFDHSPYIWAAEYYDGYTYLSCISTGLYIVQLDIDVPYVGLRG
ncbi:MAG: hypothetical protein CXT67_04160 [Methanobacteriota archaeon]|nr:MAG: hypothetical protein CXT67_04160 [Euryarchaeota archaeon]HIK78050.1 hypothetical protein [Candidatus Poseidoniales archaeon]